MQSSKNIPLIYGINDQCLEALSNPKEERGREGGVVEPTFTSIELSRLKEEGSLNTMLIEPISSPCETVSTAKYSNRANEETMETLFICSKCHSLIRKDLMTIHQSNNECEEKIRNKMMRMSSNRNDIMKQEEEVKEVKEIRKEKVRPLGHKAVGNRKKGIGGDNLGRGLGSGSGGLSNCLGGRMSSALGGGLSSGLNEGPSGGLNRGPSGGLSGGINGGFGRSISGGFGGGLNSSFDGGLGHAKQRGGQERSQNSIEEPGQACDRRRLGLSVSSLVSSAWANKQVNMNSRNVNQQSNPLPLSPFLSTLQPASNSSKKPSRKPKIFEIEEEKHEEEVKYDNTNPTISITTATTTITPNYNHSHTNPINYDNSLMINANPTFEPEPKPIEQEEGALGLHESVVLCYKCRAWVPKTTYAMHGAMSCPGPTKILCKYCNKLWANSKYKAHVESCDKKPRRESKIDNENVVIPCERCNKSIPLSQYTQHIEGCFTVPALESIECRYCNNLIPVQEIDTHEAIHQNRPMSIIQPLNQDRNFADNANDGANDNANAGANDDANDDIDDFANDRRSPLHDISRLLAISTFFDLFVNRELNEAQNGEGRIGRGLFDGNNDNNDNMVPLPPLFQFRGLSRRNNHDYTRPLDQRISNDLKCYKYNKTENNPRKDENTGNLQIMCVICTMDFEQDEVIKVLPCLHRFHIICIDRWFEQSSCCPICKKSVKT